MTIRNRLLLGLALALAAMFEVSPSIGSPASVPEALTAEEGFPYNAFDKLTQDTILADGAELKVAFAADAFKLPKADFLDWVKHSAKAVATYYGKFPVKSVRILILPADGDEVSGGTTWGYHGAATRIFVGTGVTKSALAKDWVLVHEMIHMALPELSPDHSWLAEGLAVYVESIARVQAGHLSQAQIWTDFVRAMPRGQPKDGDQGFDDNHNHARVYWGGATFCLLADLELRQRSGNKIGLQQALRGINAVTNHTEEWPIRKVLGLGDQATGMNVLTTLYDEMRATPVATDLPKLWQELGVRVDGASVAFEKTAPRAELREAIVRPMAGG